MKRSLTAHVHVASKGEMTATLVILVRSPFVALVEESYMLWHRRRRGKTTSRVPVLFKARRREFTIRSTRLMRKL